MKKKENKQCLAGLKRLNPLQSCSQTLLNQFQITKLFFSFFPFHSLFLPSHFLWTNQMDKLNEQIKLRYYLFIQIFHIYLQYFLSYFFYFPTKFASPFKPFDKIITFYRWSRSQLKINQSLAESVNFSSSAFPFQSWIKADLNFIFCFHLRIFYSFATLPFYLQVPVFLPLPYFFGFCLT